MIFPLPEKPPSQRFVRALKEPCWRRTSLDETQCCKPAVGTMNTATGTKGGGLSSPGVYYAGVVGMDSLLNAICVLVTAAVVLTFVPGLRLRERSQLSMRDQGSALLGFIILALVEEVSVLRSGLVDGERIVAACAAGLLAGPWLGGGLSLFVTWLAVGYDGLPLGSVGISILCGGLAGGWLYRWRRELAQHPLMGFGLTFAVSLLRSGYFFFYVSGSEAALYP